MNMSILLFEVELSNSTIEPLQPDDPVTFFTLFSIIAVVVIISFSILIGVISCPQSYAGNLLGFNCLGNACGDAEGDDEKEAIHCRNDSVLTFVPSAPVVSGLDSVSRDTVLSSSRSSIDTIKSLRTEEGSKATIVHIYDVIPDRKSRHQDRNYNSVQTKLVFPPQLSSLDKSDHYQTPSPVTCRLQCCHGNIEPSIKNDLSKIRQDDDVIYNAKHRRPVDPVQPQTDQKKCKPNRRDFQFDIKPSENGKHYSKMLHSERNRITKTRHDKMTTECQNVHIQPNSHPHVTLDMSGQDDPVNSLSPITGDKDILKDSTQPRLASGYQTVPATSDEINHFSWRLPTPRLACRSPCLSCCNEFLPPSFYQNVSSPQSKSKNVLMYTPENIPFTDEQCQGHHECITTGKGDNIHSPKLGFGDSFSSSDHVIHDGAQTLNSFQHKCERCSTPSKVRSQFFQKDIKSNSSRDEMSTFDFEPSTRYDTSKDSITLSSQPRTSTLDKVRYSFSFPTRYDLLSDHNKHVTTDLTRHLTTDQTRPLTTDQTRYLTTDQTRYLTTDQTNHLPSNQMRHTLSGQIRQAVRSHYTGHPLSGQTSHLPLDQTRHSPSGHNGYVLSGTTKHSLTNQGEHVVTRGHGTDSEFQNKRQFYSDDVSWDQLGRDAVTQTQELSEQFGRRTEHGQGRPMINRHDLERPTVRRELENSMIEHPTNVSTHLSAKENFNTQDVGIRLSQPYFTETSKCCQKNTHQKSHTKKITGNQMTKSNNKSDFLFDGILPFKDTCRQGQGHMPEREELQQQDRQNHSSMFSSFSDYVIMNNPYGSMTSSDRNAESPRPCCLSKGASQTKATSGHSHTVFRTVPALKGLRGMTSPYRFHTPADAIHSLKSYIRRNFSP